MSSAQEPTANRCEGTSPADEEGNDDVAECEGQGGQCQGNPQDRSHRNERREAANDRVRGSSAADNGPLIHLHDPSVPHRRGTRSLVGCPWFDLRMHEVVVGALVHEGRVLLVHRRPDKRARPDVWDFPGGLIEAGESDLAALTRELHEELGVQIVAGSATHLCRLAAGPPEEPALLSAWLVRGWQGTPSNMAPEEHDDIGWFNLEELPPAPHVIARTALLEAVRRHGG